MRGEKANRICIQKAIGYCEDLIAMYHKHNESKEEFDCTVEYQYACGMCIVQIRELVSRLDIDFMDRYADVPWRQLKGLRNIYAHDYERINTDMIWETITVDIPVVLKRLQAIIYDTGTQEEPLC